MKMHTHTHRGRESAGEGTKKNGERERERERERSDIMRTHGRERRVRNEHAMCSNERREKNILNVFRVRCVCVCMCDDKCGTPRAMQMMRPQTPPSCVYRRMKSW